MHPSEPCRVFISYARKDGASLAQRLQSDLKNEGFIAWLDTQQTASGAIWTRKIEEVLDEAEYVLALMTSGSYFSEICRAEQLRSLRRGKCVIPLLAQRGSDIPLYLEARNYCDFCDESKYHASFRQLLGDLQARRGIELKPEFRTTSYDTVPPLPVAFVDRPEALEALRNAIISDDAGRQIALTALEGMAGIGKTVLAQALCNDEVVQQAFPDGIIWITVGRESAFDAITRMREVGKALGDDLSGYDNELGAKNQYRTTIRRKAALIVVDDVWKASDIEPLRAESSRSRLLFTTRDTGIASAVGAREHIADLLTEEQSREVFLSWSGTEIGKMPAIASDLIRECGRLPLALSMVGAMLRGRPPVFWQSVLDHLRKANLEKIKAQFPDYPYTDVLRAIQVSVDWLDDASRRRYVALAVLLEEMAAAPQLQQCLWGVDQNEAAEVAEQFVSLSLAYRDQPDGSIRLHDLQLDYARAQWPNKAALELIHGAIRLSSNVIAKDPSQFSSQLVGRLLPYQDMPAIAEFIERIGEFMPTSWLQPMQAALRPPGTGLIRNLEGHKSSVTAVAVTPDGRFVISGSEDQTLKVWDLGSGRELRTLAGHGSSVTAVAVTLDGQFVISGSEDQTLKVWDLGSGRELRTLAGHKNGITAVAVTAEGRRVVSASYDKILRVWELETGRDLITLRGSTGGVTAMAVTQDGKRVAFACESESVKVWELECGHELFTLSGHSGWVTAVGVTPMGGVPSRDLMTRH